MSRWRCWMQGLLQHQRQPGKCRWCVPRHLPQHWAVQLGQGRCLHQWLQPGGCLDSCPHRSTCFHMHPTCLPQTQEITILKSGGGSPSLRGTLRSMQCLGPSCISALLPVHMREAISTASLLLGFVVSSKVITDTVLRAPLSGTGRRNTGCPSLAPPYTSVQTWMWVGNTEWLRDTMILRVYVSESFR